MSIGPGVSDMNLHVAYLDITHQRMRELYLTRDSSTIVCTTMLVETVLRAISGHVQQRGFEQSESSMVWESLQIPENQYEYNTKPLQVTKILVQVLRT